MKKYEPSVKIKTLDQFANQEFVWDVRMKKTYHKGWFKSWQFRYVEQGIKQGYYFEVSKIKREKENNEGI